MRFGVMCNGTVFQRWQVVALNELKEHGHSLVLLITDTRKVPEISRFKQLLNKKLSIFLFTFLENRVFNPDARKLADINRELAGIDILRCHVDQKGYSEYFTTADVEAIRSFRLDFILRFGFNIIRGDILTAARYGVWSFHHDDELRYRGGPAGFWEIFNRDPVNGAIMQRLTEKLDGGCILKKGYLKTVMHSYRGNLEQLLSVTSYWPSLVADEIEHNPETVFAISHTVAPVYRVPGNLQMVRFIVKLIRNKIQFHCTDLLSAEDWNIGIIRKPIYEVAMGSDNLKKTDISWMRRRSRNKYLADPSGFIENDKLHILAEEYSYFKQKAAISEIIWDMDTFRVTDHIRVIDYGKHLSYPCIIEHQGEVFCMPESYQSNNIMLYRRDPATGTFTKDRILLDKVEAVDPTLFFYNGFWWLFFTNKKYSSTHLFIYHAIEITGDYKPHCCNPVKIDIRSARPAGTPFINKGVLYRPAQDCSVTYGGRVTINKIDKLSVHEFVEQAINSVDPVAGTLYSKGLHTISGIKDFTLVDGKRYRFDRYFFISQLRKKLNKMKPENV